MKTAKIQATTEHVTDEAADNASAVTNATAADTRTAASNTAAAVNDTTGAGGARGVPMIITLIISTSPYRGRSDLDY